MIGSETDFRTCGGTAVVFHLGGTDTQLHQRRHWIVVATKRSKRESS